MKIRVWPRAFSHPGWWCALAILLLNDHLWKGSGWLPAALTGKLSDVAGMIVAPALFAFALGAANAPRRLFASASVGLGFGLVKLSPPAAAALEHALGWLGIHAHITLDASDLWALLALPLGHGATAPNARGARGSAGAALSWTRRTGLALASFACVATSGFGGGSDPKRIDAPGLKNTGKTTLTLLVTSSDGAGGCSVYRDEHIALLTPDAFRSPRTLTLKAGERAVLSEDEVNAKCGAAAISAPDGTSTFVFWRDLSEIASFVPADDARRLAREMTVEARASRVHVELGDDLHAFEPGGAPPDPDCEEAELEHSVEFSALAVASGFLEFAAVRADQDGCLEVDWMARETSAALDTQRLCVPQWAFPFTAGSRLSVTQTLEAEGARSLRVAQFSGDAIEKELVIWNGTSEFPASHIKRVAAVDCVGALSDCGAYLRPANLSVDGRKGALAQGQEASVKGDKPKEVRVLVGTARDVAWTSARCTGDDARVGSSANVLELRTY